MSHKPRLNNKIADIPIPRRMQRLPVSSTGYPIPWFVGKVDGEYDFRCVDTPKVPRAVHERLCWLCGEKLGRYLAFVIGPMCMVNRISSEPPSHRECAEYAVRACPFLTEPRMRRNEKDMPLDKMNPGGIMIPRNPGCCIVWITFNYEIVRVFNGELIRIGDPVEILYFSEGRKATRQEIMHSIETGMPLLRKAAERDGSAQYLDAQLAEAVKLLPAL